MRVDTSVCKWDDDGDDDDDGVDLREAEDMKVRALKIFGSAY